MAKEKRLGKNDSEKTHLSTNDQRPRETEIQLEAMEKDVQTGEPCIPCYIVLPSLAASSRSTYDRPSTVTPKF